jgi:Right handed beta helix region
MKHALMLLTALLLAPLAALHAAEFFVSPSGNDADAGTKAKPFATLERARDAVREAKKSGAMAGGFTVWLGAGDYTMTKPFELNEVDSGTAAEPVVYRGIDPGTVRLIGARVVKITDFIKVTNAAALARIAEAARGKVIELDLRPLGLKHATRYPDLFNDNGGLIELFFNGRRMPLARFPNQGYMTIKRVLVNGGGQAERGRWGDSKVKQSLVGPGVFEYREEVCDKFTLWQKQLERGVWFKGYWRIPWQNEAVRVAAIDTMQHTVTLAKAVPGGIGNKYTRPAGNGKEAYWLFNLLEEIDQPGEWCVDFADQKLYFYPLEPLGKAEMALADSAEPVIHLNGASHVTLRGLIIEQNLGDGIRVAGGEGVLIAGCTVRSVDKYAVVIDGGRLHTVQSCDLYNLGEGGVWLAGGDDQASPRVPAGHRVINNHIHHFSEITRIYAPAVNSGYVGGGGHGHRPAVGMLVAHNLIHDTPHAGVLSGSFDSVFEYNEVFRFALVSDDIGAFYCFDTFALDGNRTFRYNLVHHSEQGDAFYFDMDHRDMQVYGNIAFLKSGKGRGTAVIFKDGSQKTSPPQNSAVHNNVGIECNYFGLIFGAESATNRIENNVSVRCKTPWDSRRLTGGNWKKLSEPPTGRNMVYTDDPGFVNVERLDFRLKLDAQLLKDLPDFKSIPVEKIGLYVDEYRKRLPTDDEVERFSLRSREAGLGYDILDRK